MWKVILFPLYWIKVAPRVGNGGGTAGEIFKALLSLVSFVVIAAIILFLAGLV